MKKTASLLILLFTALGLRAGEPLPFLLTLSQAEQSALAHSPRLKAAQEERGAGLR